MTGFYNRDGLCLLGGTFCPHSAFMCFVWIWEQTAIISLYSINWLVFITETECLLRGTNCVSYVFDGLQSIWILFPRTEISIETHKWAEAGERMVQFCGMFHNTSGVSEPHNHLSSRHLSKCSRHVPCPYCPRAPFRYPVRAVRGARLPASLPGGAARRTGTPSVTGRHVEFQRTLE
jgi:hypothetical protein